jgi:hypothetical protein
MERCEREKTGYWGMLTGWFCAEGRPSVLLAMFTLQNVCYALCDESNEEIRYPSTQQCTTSRGISEVRGNWKVRMEFCFLFICKGHIPEDHTFYSHHCENLKFQGWDIVKLELIIYYVENCRMAAWRCQWQFPLKHWYLSSTCHHIQFLYVVLMINTFHQTVVQGCW